MTPDEARDLFGRVTFLDVREPYEWESGHLEGSRHIPIGQVASRIDELDRETPVVVVCQVGQRSELVTDWLNQNGFTAHNLEGGLAEWSAKGLPLVTQPAGKGRVIDGWARDLSGARLNPDDE